MFDYLTQLIDGSAISYVVILAIVAVDSFFPLVPGETAVISGGVFAASGDLSVPLVLLAAFAGGAIGDNVTYWLGRLLGARARRRWFCSDKALHRLAWAETQLEQRGGPIIVAARFIPGGRTATMFSAGSLEMPWPKFVLADLAAAGIWAGYAFALGFLGGETFQHSLWKPLAIAFAIAAVVTGLGELYRRFRMPDDDREVRRREKRFKREAKQAAREREEEKAAA